MGEMRNAYKILVGNLKSRDHSGDLGLEGRIILNFVLKLGFGGRGLDSFGSGYRLVASSCEQSNEPLGSIKGGEFLD
jgi:hypothetical protein